jgi:general secretion pathway protein C
MPQVWFDRANLAQNTLIAMATVTALIVLGFVAAYWTWGWLAPRPESRAPAAADMGGVSAAALFGNVPQAERNNATQVATGIKLLGVVASTSGQRGYAVVEIDPRQILAVEEGEDIAPGIRLTEVSADHVRLERDGAPETLTWPDKKSTEPAPIRTNR